MGSSQDHKAILATDRLGSSWLGLGLRGPGWSQKQTKVEKKVRDIGRGHDLTSVHDQDLGINQPQRFVHCGFVDRLSHLGVTLPLPL